MKKNFHSDKIAVNVVKEEMFKIWYCYALNVLNIVSGFIFLYGNETTSVQDLGRLHTYHSHTTVHIDVNSVDERKILK